jgi:hypothetical protein
MTTAKATMRARLPSGLNGGGLVFSNCDEPIPQRFADIVLRWHLRANRWRTVSRPLPVSLLPIGSERQARGQSHPRRTSDGSVRPSLHARFPPAGRAGRGDGERAEFHPCARSSSCPGRNAGTSPKRYAFPASAGPRLSTCSSPTVGGAGCILALRICSWLASWSPMMNSPDHWWFRRRQVKAARGLLGWSQTNLAHAASVGVSTVRDYERGARRSNKAFALYEALENAGIEFTPKGVRLKEEK